MKEKSLSGSGQKIQEYIDRIRAGESRDSITQGLPPSFVAGIEAGLIQEGSSEFKNEDAVIIDQQHEIDIPPQYRGLDADTLDFAWTIPEYIDREKTEREKERKQKVVDALRKKESDGIRAQEGKLVDGVKIEQIRKDLGIGSDEALATKQQELASVQNNKEGENLFQADGASGRRFFLHQGRRAGLPRNIPGHSR